MAELSISKDYYLYVYPRDINGYVATNEPITLSYDAGEEGYYGDITTFQEPYETDCKAVVDHFTSNGNMVTVYLNIFSLILKFHNAKFNVKIKNSDEIVYETVVNTEGESIRPVGDVGHQDFGVSTGVVVNTMPKEREEIGINYINPASYGRIFPKFYYVNNQFDSYPNKEITGSVTTGNITNSGGHPLLWDFELVQAQTDNNTGVVRDLKGTYTISNDEINVESTIPITIRQVGNEKYTHIIEEIIPYNKTCVSFAYGAYHPYKYKIKVPNYVSYIQVENNQSGECYTAVLYDLELNNTEDDREIKIPYDVLNGEDIVESGEMVIVQKAPLSVSSTEILVPSEGGEYYVSVNCSGEGTIETSKPFFEVVRDEDGFIVKVSKNQYAEPKQGFIYVKSGYEVVEITIKQDPQNPYMLFNKHYIPVKRTGELLKLKLNTNTNGTTEGVTQ